MFIGINSKDKEEKKEILERKELERNEAEKDDEYKITNKTKKRGRRKQYLK